MFGDMITDMESNKNASRINTEFFLRGKKFNILTVFISQSYVKVPKTIRLNTTHYLIKKVPNKKHFSK